jgi:flagellar motor protein MotB
MADKGGTGQTMAQSTAMAEELRLCAEESKSIWTRTSSFLINDAGVRAFLVTALCMITLPWIWLQSLRLFLYAMKSVNIKQGQERLKQAINRDRTLKDLIEQLEAEKGEQEKEQDEDGNSTGKKKPEKELNYTRCADHNEVTPLCGESALPSPSGPEAPVFVNVPSSKGQATILGHMARKKLEVNNRSTWKGSHTLHSKVELSSPEALETLHDLADEGAKIDKKSSVQLSKWRILVPTAGKATVLQIPESTLFGEKKLWKYRLLGYFIFFWS